MRISDWSSDVCSSDLEMRLARPDQRPGECDGPRIALPRRALHRRAAGKTQPEDFCYLVERLARRVVDGRGEPPVAADSIDRQQLAMAAGRKKQQIGNAKLRFDQARAERMALQMVDRDQRL